MMTHGTFMPSSPPNAAEMQSSQPGSPADSTSIDATGMTSEAQESVKSAVLVWVESFRAKDAAKNAACYAPLVDRYFRRNNVSREQVQQYKQTAFEQMLDIRKFDVSNVRIEVVPSFQRAENSVHYDRVSAVFQKEWDDTESTGMTFSGREIEKLTFTSSSEGWKIVREEEVEIIEVHRERAELSTYSSRDTSVSEGALNVIPPSSTPLSDLSGNWQGEYTNHDTNEVRKVTLQISRHDADLTGTLIFDPGGGNAASCTITGVYNDQKKFMLLKIADCQGHPPAYLQGYIGFSSIELTARQVFGVDPSHNGWLNINKQ
jgi:ketosteroid isomerase-like protein